MMRLPATPVQTVFILAVFLVGLVCIPIQGQSDQAPRMIEFAGYTWQVKGSDTPMGPGPNHFSADERDVYVDDTGRLHLLLSRRGDKWLCTEIISDWPVGYGTYEFRLAGGAEQLDPNIVLGLFTWDNESWQTDANSEIDIELTRWGKEGAPNLHYAVHPAWGPDGKHHERVSAEQIDLQGQGSTHTITWLPDRVVCAIYRGQEGPAPERLIHQWRYDADNPARVTTNGDGNTTDPIGIPKPHPTTTARINLWLLNADRTDLGDAPADGQPAEVIVTGFRYTPAESSDQTPNNPDD